MTSTYHNGALEMYTTSISKFRDALRQGAAAYRNARDWAKQKKDEAIVKANDKIRRIKSELSAPGEPDSSAEEFGIA
ncbi:hypothetical protein F4678DRAFT_463150 [Xylaria arbuscula]|nr:hypothetical protein F4678DRAFT_463150 [Xylaria arbuscula]